MAVDPSTFLSTPSGYATPQQQAGAQQLSSLATPQQIQSMYDYAKALKASSTDTPVKAWTQGVGNIVKALMGNVEEGSAADAQRQRDAYNSGQIPDPTKTSAPGDLPGFGTIDTNRPPVTGGDQPSDPGLAAAESGGNDQAKNPQSSASGRYQFTDGTWADVMKRHPDLGLTADGRSDPAQQEKAKAAYTADNDKVLSTAGYDPSQANERLAMRFGANGATKVLGADPSAPMSSIMPSNVMAVNPDLANATAGSTAQRYASIGAPQLPPDAQNMTKALAGGTQVAQNGPMQPGMLPQQQGGFDPQMTITMMARGLARGGMPVNEALQTATQYVSNQLQLMPQYGADTYGREIMTRPGMPPQFTGRQLGPGLKGSFMDLPTTTTVGPDQQEHIRIQTPESGPPAQAPQGPTSGPQGAAAVPGNVGAIAPPTAPTAGVAAAAPPSSVNVAGPLPQGTQVPEPPTAAPPPPSGPAGAVMPPMPGPNANIQDWGAWQANTAAAKAAAISTAQTSAEESVKGREKLIDADIDAGNKSYDLRNTLGFMKDAYENGGDNMNGGPWGQALLQGKQFLNEMGLEGDWTKGLQPSEIANKLNFALSSQMVREITSRGTQMEILLGMKNNPGLLMSNKGAEYMLNILDQTAAQKQQWGQIASQYDPSDKGYLQAKQRFFETHPLVSPFTGKPLNSAKDVNADFAHLPQTATPTQGTPPSGLNVPPPPPPAAGKYTYDPKTKILGPQSVQAPAQ
jgi:hypothetical protein